MRQLEAIIRLSEAIARIYLSTQVLPAHVEEAHRIFNVSTMHAAASGLQSTGTEAPADMQPMIAKIEEAIKRRVAIGTKISYPKLQEELQNRFDNARAIDLAIVSMVRRDEMEHQEGRKILTRKR